MIAVVVILLILAFLLTSVVSRLPGAADRVKCTSNLRSLYVGLSSYLDDNGHWPQQPFGFSQQQASDEWWIQTMKPYGIPENTWKCPGITRLGKINNGPPARVHYSPTPFDPKPSTPRKWNWAPWVIEIGSPHGPSSLCVITDGSVHEWDEIIKTHAQ